VNENDGIRVREARSCLLCGCEGALLYANLQDRLFGAPGNWNLMQCPECQLVWINPQPIPEDVGKLYARYYTHQKHDASKRMLAGLRRSVNASILKSSFGYQMNGPSKIIGSMLSWIGPLKELAGGEVLWLEYGEQRRLLDVGCGNGSFLVHMRKLGWEVTGIEPDEEAISAAREKFGLEAFHGSLEEAKFPDGHFDAITMNHVIEHVLDPIELLKECNRILRPGGTLVVVTPNINSLGRYSFGEYWRGLEVPRHVFLFSPDAMKSCAERSGLVVHELQTKANIARWMWPTSRLIKRDGMVPGGSPKELSFCLRMEGLAFQAVEYGLSSRRELGEELVLMASR